MKAQAAMEFMLVIGLVITSFIGFMYILSDQIVQVADNEDKVAMHNLGTRILNEINVARQVHSNYLRFFDIEPDLNGKKYDINLIDEVITAGTFKSGVKVGLKINILGDFIEIDNVNVSKKSAIYGFPEGLDIYGDFVEVRNDTYMGYCITKGTKGEITISRNQIGFKPAQVLDTVTDIWRDARPVTEIEPSRFNVPTPLLGKDVLFSLYLVANCVNNFQQVGFDLKLEHDDSGNDNFIFVEARDVLTHKTIYSGDTTNMYGEDMFDGDKVEVLGAYSKPQDRIMITHWGNKNRPSGSDALIELVFKKTGVGTGQISIEKDTLKYVDASLNFIPPAILPILIP